MQNVINLKSAKDEIENMILKMEIDEAEREIEKYEKDYPYDLDLFLMKINIYFYKEEYDKADEELLKIYSKYEFNQDINYNLGMIKYCKKQYLNSLYYLMKSATLNKKEEYNFGTIIQEISKNVSQKDFDNVITQLKSEFVNNQRSFPYSLIEGKLQYGMLINNQGYYCGIYDNYNMERDNLDIYSQGIYYHLTKTETMRGKMHKRIRMKLDEKCIIPIMMKNNHQPLEIKINNEQNTFKYLLKDRFYYYTFDAGTDVRIKSDENFVMGDKIILKKDISKPSLILNIFIDGLSQKFIEEYDLEKIAPNIYKFFKEGTICNNAYTTGEWTYVSLASFFTGKYTTNHRIYHPNYDTNNLSKNELYSEVFQKEGYYCAKIDGDWRSNPSLGYTKGMDLYIYQPSIRAMNSEDVIMETIEHLETFKEKNNFLWICIPDLHDIADEYETKHSVQVNSSVACRAFEKSNETSVRKSRDDSKEERFKMQLKRIDTYLNILFNYIRDNYEENDILVSLVADHGQGYLVKSGEFLDEERTKIPMMFRGKNIPKGNCTELISGLDLMPIMLNAIGAKMFDKKDGNIPKYFGGDISRKYAYSECIFPNAPYYATLNDEKYKLFFTSKELCQEDGRININGYSVNLIEKSTGNDKTNEELEKVNEFTNVVLDHIKEYIVND